MTPKLDSMREHVCPCGIRFNPARHGHPGTARYCSNECRVRFGRFGRSYGVVVPRQYGWARS